jgi:predicted RNA binding protein YcfA (HicA-like mRNA interferase family)
MIFNDIAGARLISQKIYDSDYNSVDTLVSWMGALQAQDYNGALWSIGLRLPGSKLSDITTAISKREIIRTWPMRGTLHFVSSRDVKWMLKLMAPRVIAGTKGRIRNLGLDDATFKRARDLFSEELYGDKQLVKSEMLAVLEKAGISTAGQRGAHIIGRLSQEGLLCLAAHQGKQPAFALLSEWAPNALSLPRDESIRRVTAVYFKSHGPATIKDFVRWSGLTITEAKLGIELSKDELALQIIGGVDYWLNKNQLDKTNGSSSAYALPGFDEYMLGYGDRSAALDKMHSSKIVPGNNGMFLPTIVINGKVVGTWKKLQRKNSLVITPMPFKKLSQLDLKLFNGATDQYAKFLGTKVEVKS